MRTPATAALAALALSASAAGAQPFLEFSFSGAGQSFSGNSVWVSARFVVDAGDPAQDVIASTAELETNSDSPFPPALDGPLFSSFFMSEGDMTLQCASFQGAFASVTVFLIGSPSVVADPDGSIPDDPAAYTGWDRASADLANAVDSDSVVWFETSGFGDPGESMVFRVREVPDPSPPEACVADLAEPLGVLNFDDVLAYLSAFGAGCP